MVVENGFLEQGTYERQKKVKIFQLGRKKIKNWLRGG